MRLLACILAAIIAYLLCVAIGFSAVLGGGEFKDDVPGGFSSGVDLGLDAEQMRNLEISMRVAEEEKAPALAVLAMVVSGFGESEFRVVPNQSGSGYCGVFQAHPNNIDCDDTEEQAYRFQRGGKGFQANGAIYLARENPGMSPGTIATRVEASGQPGSFYDKHRERAERVIEAWISGAAENKADDVDFIAEANRMISLHKPYEWGGGHINFSRDGPWDCSGAISWLMHYLGLLDGRPLTSGEFMTEGKAGRGEQFTIYANTEHVFLIAERGSHRGDSWGTATRDLEGAQGSGPMWHHHSTRGFVARHYDGY